MMPDDVIGEDNWRDGEDVKNKKLRSVEEDELFMLDSSPSLRQHPSPHPHRCNIRAAVHRAYRGK